ncbi:unnamed protein product [Symbiodinium natans]|uniref:Uncharacterized protein n=1 Tax=Symbiodinium natans TaxID=878477 RepID=A0A812L1T0_9DINO|nr:unnamed protein product [Symbiodinium natans]
MGTTGCAAVKESVCKHNAQVVIVCHDTFIRTNISSVPLDGFTRVQSKETMFEVLCQTFRELGQFPALNEESPLRLLMQDDMQLPSPLRLKLSLERSIEAMGREVRQGEVLNEKLRSLVVSILKDKQFDEVFTTVPPSMRSSFARWMDAQVGDPGSNPDVAAMFRAANSYTPSPVEPLFEELTAHDDPQYRPFYEEQRKGLHRMRRQWLDLEKGTHPFWLFHPWLLLRGQQEQGQFVEFLQAGLQLQLFTKLESPGSMTVVKEMAFAMSGPAYFQFDNDSSATDVMNVLAARRDLMAKLEQAVGDVYWLELCDDGKMWKPGQGNEPQLAPASSGWWQTDNHSQPVVGPGPSKSAKL